MTVGSRATSAPAIAPPRSGTYLWFLAALQIALVLGTAALLWPTTSSLTALWSDSADTGNTSYTHGYLIAAVSLWLIVRNRDRLQGLAVGAYWPGMIALAGAALVWLVFLRAGIQTAHQMLLPILMWLAICATLGRQVAYTSAFAIGYWYFAIDWWGTINGALQGATVIANDFLLSLTGVPAYVEGNIVHLAAGDLEIGGGCSGLHFFIVALATAALYGEINRDSLRTRALLLALAAMLALLTNWIRVYIIVVAAYFTDMQHYLVRVDHLKFGWVLFAIMTVIFFVIARRLPLGNSAPAADPAAEVRDSTRSSTLVAAAVLALIAVAPIWNTLRAQPSAVVHKNDNLLPRNVGSWLRMPAGNWSPEFYGADAQQVAVYRMGEQRIDAYIAHYEYQEQGKELIGYRNHLHDADEKQIGAAPVLAMPFRELHIEHAAGEALIWYAYRIGDAQTVSSLRAQLTYGARSLIIPVPSRIIAVRSECKPDCTAGRTRLRDFVEVFGNTHP